MNPHQVIPKVATVHEKTVQKAVELASEQKKTRRRGPQRRVHVNHIKVDPRVWEKAVEIAGGDCKRIVVVNETEVVVHNHPQNGNRHHLKVGE